MDTRVRTGLRIPCELNIRLIREADEQGVSKNALILQILWNWVSENSMEKKVEQI